MVITSLTCIFCNGIFHVPEEFAKHLEMHKLTMYDGKSPTQTSGAPGSQPAVVTSTTGQVKIESNEVIKSDLPILNNSKEVPPPTRDVIKCENELSSKSASINAHNETAHKKQNNIFICEVCKKGFPTKSRLKMHQSIHDPNRKKKECPICLKMFTPVWFAKHYNMHKNLDEKLFKCDSCDKPFGSLVALKTHKQNVHLKNRRYACDKCDREYQHKDGLRLHELNKHQRQPRECPVCKKVVHTVTGLRMHVKRHNDPRYQKKKCPVCLKVLAARTVKLHEKMHAATTKDKLIICDMCGKMVADPYRLKLHMRIHTGEKPYSCDVCGRSFSKSETLRGHKRIHTNERPYICKVCNRGFTQRTPLKVHMRSHTGERPYACHICPKKFITRGLLNGHRCPGPS